MCMALLFYSVLGVVFYVDNVETNFAENAFYIAFQKVTISFALYWIIFAIFKGYAGNLVSTSIELISIS